MRKSKESAIKRGPAKDRAKTADQGKQLSDSSDKEDQKQWFEKLLSKNFHEDLKMNREVAAQEIKISNAGNVEGMTKVTRQAIMQRKFDYATLSACVSDIRKNFWNIGQVNEFYKNKLKETHSHFYQQLIPGRTEERIEMTKRLKKGGFIKAMNLVDGDLTKAKQKKKDRQHKFDSGSDGESRR